MQTWTLANGSIITFDESELDQSLTLSPEEAVSLDWLPVQQNGHAITVPVDEEG